MKKGPASLSYFLLSNLVVVSLLSNPIAAAPPFVEVPEISLADRQTSSDYLESFFHTKVTLDNEYRRRRLNTVGVTVLDEGEGWATVLFTSDQRETVTSLRFQPWTTDGLSGLVDAGAQSTPWLAESLSPLLEQAEDIQAGPAAESAPALH